MSSILALSPLRSHRKAGPKSGLIAGVVVCLALALAGAALIAQVGGERGIAPIASSSDIEVRGIEVNTRGDNPQDARENGWRRARRIAWSRLDGPQISDSQLDGLIAAIIVEEESIGPRRYIARLGVIFDRQRAGGLLGTRSSGTSSAPMLTLPVLVSGGTQTMFEVRNVWQRAWAEHQFGSTTIDYVRPVGAAGDSLLLTAGQTGRHSRAWWNVVLNQFSAADVVVPVARLEYQWPGGPVEGHFTARYGPDNRFLEAFSLRAESQEGLPQMLESAVIRFDEIYAQALASGTLSPDPTLSLDMIEVSPEILALVEEAQRAEEFLLAQENGTLPIVQPNAPPLAADDPQAAIQSVVVVQVATPDARAFDGALTGVRAVPGVSAIAVTSTAIGGTSVMRITFAGSISELAAALRGYGWQVTQGNNALAISR